MYDVFFRTVEKITNPWSLGAYAMALLVYLATRRKGQVPKAVWVCIVLVAVTPMIISGYLEFVRARETKLYRVRVIVLDMENVPVEDATVWSSGGGEPKKIAGGWQFDIPAATKPADGRFTFFADVPEAFLRGQEALLLEDDYNPTVKVQLHRETSGIVRGIVVDNTGRGQKGVSVSVVGYEADAVITKKGGHFLLPAHAADGQQIRLHAEKPDCKPVNQFYPAGDHPVTISMDCK